MGSKNTFIYLEDDNGYSVQSIAFQTNFSGTIDQLVKISWAKPGAGRLSTKFSTFCSYLKAAGFSCEFLMAYATDEISDEFPLVTGATGNY